MNALLSLIFDLGYHVLVLFYVSAFSGGFFLKEDWDRIECGVMKGLVLMLARRS